jgi:hypothetical protein
VAEAAEEIAAMETSAATLVESAEKKVKRKGQPLRSEESETEEDGEASS